MYRGGLALVNRREKQPGIFYFHPWEIDAAQPRIEGCGWKSRFRHYTNLAQMAGKLDRLLGDFAWDRMDRVYADLLVPEAQTDTPSERAAVPVCRPDPARRWRLRYDPRASLRACLGRLRRAIPPGASSTGRHGRM